MHLSLVGGAPAIGLFEVVEIFAQNDVVRGEPGLVYPSLERGSVIGRVWGVNIDDS